MDSAILSILVFLPLLGAACVFLAPSSLESASKHITLAFTAIAFLLSLHLVWHWDGGTSGFQYALSIPWISNLGIHYTVGIDGFSLWLVMLTTFLMPIVVLSSYTAVEKRAKGFYTHLLLIETGMLGAFVSLNMVLFYVFWEFMLIPMYFLIGIWGGQRRIYATLKFFIFTMIGSLLMLVAIVAMAWFYRDQTGLWSFEYSDWLGMSWTSLQQKWMFSAFALAFLVKVPIFPFHTWLPDAHVEAPTAGSVILAGVLLKMGTYGLARFAMPFFPDALQWATPVIGALAVVGIVYGALVAMVQPDIKKLIAYSSVSHLGFCVLGLLALNPQGIQGAFLQMIGHGLSTGALFMLVGVIYERRHTRLISEYGGLAKVMPFYSTLFVIATLSSIGLPGLNGFVGEFLILMGSFRAFPPFGIIAATGVILGAVYMLWMVQRVFFGPVKVEANLDLKDLRRHEWISLLLIILPMFWIGLYPKFFTDKMKSATTLLLHQTAIAETLDPERDEVTDRVEFLMEDAR